MINRLKSKFTNLDGHTIEVVKKSFSSILIKVLGMCVATFSSIYIGRALGASGVGLLDLSSRIVGMLLVLTLLGFPKVVLKYVAIGYDQKDWKKVGDVIFTSILITSFLTITISVLGFFFARFISNYFFNESLLEVPLKIAFITMIPISISRIVGSGLNGFKKIWQSNLVNETLSSWFVAICLVLCVQMDIKIDVVNVAIIFAISRVVVVFFAVIYWNKLFDHKIKKQFIYKPLLKMAMPLLLVSSTAVLASSTDALMLGWLGDVSEVGLYNIGSRIALLSSIFLTVSNSALAPKIASLYNKGSVDELEIMVQKITRFLGLISLVGLPIFYVYGYDILSLWGEDFRKAYWILLILSVAQVFNLATGATGQILMMCGKEKILGRLKLIEVLLNIILNYFLIIHFQAIGAAFATGITIISLNLTKVYFVKKELGISMLKIKLK